MAKNTKKKTAKSANEENTGVEVTGVDGEKTFLNDEQRNKIVEALKNGDAATREFYEKSVSGIGQWTAETRAQFDAKLAAAQDNPKYGSAVRHTMNALDTAGKWSAAAGQVIGSAAKAAWTHEKTQEGVKKAQEGAVAAGQAAGKAAGNLWKRMRGQGKGGPKND